MRALLAAAMMLCALQPAYAEGTITYFVSPEHPYLLRYDPAVWKSDAGEGEIDMVLNHHTGKAEAVVIAFDAQGTLDDLRAAGLKNGRETAPDLKVTFEERVKKEGAEIMNLRVAGTTAEGKVTHYGAYWIGEGKAIQLIVSTTPDALGEVEKDMLALIDGFGIRVPKKEPEQQRAFTMSYAPLKWRVDSDGSDGGDMAFTHTSGHSFAFAQAQEAEQTPRDVRAYVLEQAKQAAPDVKLVAEEKKKVNGVPVLSVRLEGTTADGVRAVFYGYFFHRPGVFIQAVTVTPKEHFAAVSADLTEFLDGLQIQQQ